MLYRGTVTRATATGVWALVPGLVPGAEFGPMPLVDTGTGPWHDEPSGPGPHVHPITGTRWTPDQLVRPGDTVLVADLGVRNLPDLVCVGVLV